MNHEHAKCEDFELLISAMIDGELDATESAELSEHMNQCSGCRETAQNFSRVDMAVSLLSRKPIVQDVSQTSSPDKEVFVVSRDKPSMKDWFSLKRLVPLAVAAAVLIGLGMMMFPAPKAATANSFSTDQFVQPMKDLHLINVQQRRDQDLMLRTLTMDLRALKLELNQLEPGSEKRSNLATEIDLMIAKVQDFESQN